MNSLQRGFVYGLCLTGVLMMLGCVTSVTRDARGRIVGRDRFIRSPDGGYILVGSEGKTPFTDANRADSEPTPPATGEYRPMVYVQAPPHQPHDPLGESYTPMSYVQSAPHQPRNPQGEAYRPATYVQSAPHQPRNPRGEAYRSATYVQGAAHQPRDPQGESYRPATYVPGAAHQPRDPLGEAYRPATYVQNAPRAPRSPQGEAPRPATYVPVDAPRGKRAAQSSPGAVYVPNRKNGFLLPPEKLTQTNWDYAVKEIQKHEELKGRLGAVGWIWSGLEYVAVNSAGEAVAGKALGLKPTRFQGLLLIPNPRTVLWETGQKAVRGLSGKKQ